MASDGDAPVAVVPVKVKSYGPVHLKDQDSAFVHVVAAADSKAIRGGVDIFAEDLSVAFNCVRLIDPVLIHEAESHGFNLSICIYLAYYVHFIYNLTHDDPSLYHEYRTNVRKCK